MTQYIYRVVPAPAKGDKSSGAKGAEARFARGLEAVINTQARDGWEYLRAENLPSQERKGLTGTQTVQRSVLVFRRPADAASETAAETAPARSALFARREPPLNTGPIKEAPAPRRADTDTGPENDAPAGDDTPRP
ncbi:hypothetical protein [Roseovarius amoyensis]|uniref:hypothetical protein n=1 Tax=Roseovarius amoyensis TaxID=2211448 RepID=UPI000DBE1A0E|nr:hypothetical protein [Roseovarius amoyensis]